MEANLAHGGAADGAVLDGTNVGRSVCQGQLAIGGARRFQHDHTGQFQRQTVAQHGVFGHRKAVACRQRQDKMARVKSVHL